VQPVSSEAFFSLIRGVLPIAAMTSGLISMNTPTGSKDVIRDEPITVPPGARKIGL
jgi:hypothetical protein